VSASRRLYRRICHLVILLTPLCSPAAGLDCDPALGIYACHKIIPVEYEQPILKALSYFPELREVPIEFRIKKAYTPLATRPNFAALFKRKNHRTYIITISNHTIAKLQPLLFENLSFDEQVGIIGHELSHVVDFNNKNFFQTAANGLGHLSKKFLDRMEFNTDLLCIRHGLGKYLESYSMHVRGSMHVHNWRGVDFVNKENETHERYMNPGTIEKYTHELQQSSESIR
jgi:hypothetical protein